MDAANYQSPLSSRYASEAMRTLFSDNFRFQTWRRLWIALARSERELGLAIREDQIAELEAHATDLNLEVALRYERELRHDVMGQIHAWGEQCPNARPIIHLGATSCFVTDNADLIAMREALQLVRRQLVSTIDVLARFAREWRALPTLGYTHYQPAQATTVGKRATLWAQDLAIALEQVGQHRPEVLREGIVEMHAGDGLHDAPLFQGYFAIERRREAENDAALDLRPDRVGVDGSAAIHSTDHTPNARPTSTGGTVPSAAVIQPCCVARCGPRRSALSAPRSKSRRCRCHPTRERSRSPASSAT
mgnify:CR=1 FL=1